MRRCRYCKWLNTESCPVRSFSMVEIVAAGGHCFERVKWYIAILRWIRGERQHEETRNDD